MDTVQKSYLTKSAINLKKVSEIKVFAGELIFWINKDKELRFDMNLIDKADLEHLQNNWLPTMKNQLVSS